MNNCKVSIIIPVYNVEKYLKICLDSVLTQTFSDYELILVDDGSTDSSALICDEYAEKDSRVRVIHQPNKGLASARNSGIRQAKAEYIFFLDSDDSMDPRLLEIAVDLADWKNAGIVQIDINNVPEDYGLTAADKETVFNSVVTGDNTSWRALYQEFDIIEGLYNLDKDNKAISEDIRLTTTVVWSKLYRSSCFENNSLLFPEGMRMHEDQMVAHRNIVKAAGMLFVNLPLYRYRHSNSSLITSGWTRKRLAILDCYEDRLDCVLDLKKRIEGGEIRISNLSAKEDSKILKEDNTLFKRASDLADYIYKRTLVCMFRNYYMISVKMTGQDKKQEKKSVLKRINKLLQLSPGKLSFKDNVFYHLFLICPELFIFIFGLREKARR